MAQPIKTAIILAGGVAKGAFEAGALDVIAAAKLPVEVAIATSSGALNATMYTAGLRIGQAQRAAHTGVELWLDEATWHDVFDLTAKGVVSGRALSTSDKLLAMMRRYVDPLATEPATNSVQLRVIVAPLLGVPGRIGTQPATTFEAALAFDETSYATPEGRDALYCATAASAAFPFIFAPVTVEGLGPCYDGSVVNDTPLKLASDCGASRVILIAPYPLVFDMHDLPEGLKLLPHLADILVHERLYRDLRDAIHINHTLAEVENLYATGVLDATQRDAVVRALGNPTTFDILQIRPDDHLPGTAFSGLFDRDLRVQYVEAGRRAAEAALARL
jgi:NTE family protein